MPHLSIFDIAGPIMVGPSSSHTAGACKIGQFARALFHKTPQKVTFYLHGSFGEVYKGHATDKALLGGVMKFRTSDSDIKNAFEIAKEKGIKYEFIKKNLGLKWHPNTVKIVLEDGKYKMAVIGSSIGGGMIEILQIDSFKVHIRGRAGKHLSLVVMHDKSPSVTRAVVKYINSLGGIAVDEVVGQSLKDKTLSVVSMEGRRILLSEVMELEKIKGVDYARALSKLQKQQ